jgi:hypothetical protein
MPGRRNYVKKGKHNTYGEKKPNMEEVNRLREAMRAVRDRIVKNKPKSK